MSDAIFDLLKELSYGANAFDSFVGHALRSPACFLASIFCIFFGLMLILAVFKIFSMIIRIFLDWRIYR